MPLQKTREMGFPDGFPISNAPEKDPAKPACPFAASYCFQKLGNKIVSTVKISKRPVIIKKERYHLEKSDNSEKLPTAPIEPNPTPTLPNEAKTAPIVSSNPTPSKVRTKQLKTIKLR